MSKSNVHLTDFEIMQLAATLASNPHATPQQLVSRMFECANFIRTELKAAPQDCTDKAKDLEQFFKTI